MYLKKNVTPITKRIIYTIDVLIPTRTNSSPLIKPDHNPFTHIQQSVLSLSSRLDFFARFGLATANRSNLGQCIANILYIFRQSVVNARRVVDVVNLFTLDDFRYITHSNDDAVITTRIAFLPVNIIITLYCLIELILGGVLKEDVANASANQWACNFGGKINWINTFLLCTMFSG